MKYGNGREALLAAVVKVVGESGLVGLTNRKVGSAAGVDNSLITYYFRLPRWPARGCNGSC